MSTILMSVGDHWVVFLAHQENIVNGITNNKFHSKMMIILGSTLSMVFF